MGSKPVYQVEEETEDGKTVFLVVNRKTGYVVDECTSKRRAETLARSYQIALDTPDEDEPDPTDPPGPPAPDGPPPTDPPGGPGGPPPPKPDPAPEDKPKRKRAYWGDQIKDDD